MDWPELRPFVCVARASSCLLPRLFGPLESRPWLLECGDVQVCAMGATCLEADSLAAAGRSL